MPNRRAPATPAELPAMMEFVIAQARAAGLGDHHLFQVELAAEEILTNIIKYAYPNVPGDMEVSCAATPEGFQMVFSDEGPAFDPLSTAEPSLDTAITERQVGGLGLFLVRKFMEKVEYTRQDGHNRLRMVKLRDSGDQA